MKISTLNSEGRSRIKATLALATISFFALSGCDYGSSNLSIESVGGKVYLLDQKEREIYLVDESRLVELEKSTYSSSTPRVLSHSQLIAGGKTSADAKVKFIDSQAFYVLNLVPQTIKEMVAGAEIEDKTNFDWLEGLKNDYSSSKYVVLQMYDSDGFKIADQQVKIASGPTTIVNGEGGYLSLKYEGGFSISEEESKYIQTINFVWNL